MCLTPEDLEVHTLSANCCKMSAFLHMFKNGVCRNDFTLVYLKLFKVASIYSTVVFYVKITHHLKICSQVSLH